jgi:hypothetical protein
MKMLRFHENAFFIAGLIADNLNIIKTLQFMK